MTAMLGALAAVIAASATPGRPLTVDLPQPLGDRELVDGGEFPPAPAGYLERGGGIALRAP